MKVLILLTAILLSSTSLAGCDWLEKKMDIQEQTEKRFKLNPNPKEAYRIRVKIDDAPGPLKPMNDLDVRYMAWNCSYNINRFEGVDTEPTKRIQTKLYPVGEGEYVTTVYLDAMLDEDYFGQGVCRWELDGFGVSFKATGRPEETEFNVSDLMKNLVKENKLVNYYWKGSYPYILNDDGTIYNDDNVISFGSTTPDGYASDRQKDLFTITVTLEEIK